MNPLTAIAFILCTISFFLFYIQGKHRNFLIIAKLIAPFDSGDRRNKIQYQLPPVYRCRNRHFLLYTKVKKDIIKEIPKYNGSQYIFYFLYTYRLIGFSQLHLMIGERINLAMGYP